MGEKLDGRVPILMYHQISASPLAAYARYTVTPRTFAQQMALLAAFGYTAVTLDAVLASRAGGEPLPARPVVLTFDDGYAEAVHHATEILPRHAFTATFYLVSGLIGTTSRWTLDTRGIEIPLIDWSTARDLPRAGFTCGSHTMTHRRLAELPNQACRSELVESKQRLQDALGCEVAHVAYPFGSVNDAVEAAAREAGYRSACSVGAGLSPLDDDPLRLRRVPVIGGESLAAFACRVWCGRPPAQIWQHAMQHVHDAVSRRGSAVRHSWM